MSDEIQLCADCANADGGEVGDAYCLKHRRNWTGFSDYQDHYSCGYVRTHQEIGQKCSKFELAERLK